MAVILIANKMKIKLERLTGCNALYQLFLDK